MKAFICSLLVAGCTMATAQNVVYHEPLVPLPVHNPMTPLPILDLFARKYPRATPYWGIEKNRYVVRYIDPETQLGHVLVYDRQGRVFSREDEIPLDECPPGLQTYYQENYADEGLTVWCFEAGEELRYFIRRQAKVVWFDRDGNLIGRKLFGIL